MALKCTDLVDISQTITRHQPSSPQMTTCAKTTANMSNEPHRETPTSKESGRTYSILRTDTETGDMVDSARPWSSEDGETDVPVSFNSNKRSHGGPSATICARNCVSNDVAGDPVSVDDESSAACMKGKIIRCVQRKEQREASEDTVYSEDRKEATLLPRTGSRASRKEHDDDAVDQHSAGGSSVGAPIVKKITANRDLGRFSGNVQSHSVTTSSALRGNQMCPVDWTTNELLDHQRCQSSSAICNMKSEDGKMLPYKSDTLAFRESPECTQHQQRKYDSLTPERSSESGVGATDSMKERGVKMRLHKGSCPRDEATQSPEMSSQYVCTDRGSTSSFTAGSNTLNYDTSLPLDGNAAVTSGQQLSPAFQANFTTGSSAHSLLNPYGSTHHSEDSYRGDFCGGPLDCPMKMGSCISPMLAAAAVAALAGGRFSSTSATSQFDSLFTSQSSGKFSTHLTDFNLRPGDLSLVERTATDRSQSRGDAEQDTPLSPMHAMYNTSKLLFGNMSGDRLTADTPSPPSLSASVSPRITELCKPRDLYDSMMQEDEGDEEDEGENDEEAEDMESAEQETSGTEITGKTGSGQHWTFEEQFKQLYVLSDDPKRKEFLDELFAYMQRRGTPVNRIPIMAKQVLDLYELFHLVVARGGLVEVINKKLWREITKGLSLPSSITSAAFTLRTQYMKYLYPYECDTLGLSSPSELQAAIDGNRREARRSSYSFDYSMIINPSGMNRTMSPSNMMNNQPSNMAMNPTIPVTAMLSNPRLAASTSVPSSGGSPDVLPSISHLSGMALPFSGSALGLTAQAMHPMLGFSSGAGTGLPIQVPPSTVTHQLSSTSHQLFPPHFIHPMASTAGFPFGSSNNLPSLMSGGMEEIAIGSSSAHATSCLFPGIPSSLAAAAATLFGAGFPAIPGAFVSGSSQTLTSEDHVPGAGTCCRPSPSSQTRSGDDLTQSNGTRNQMSQLGVGSFTGPCAHQRIVSRSPSPLNLAANEEDLDNQSNKNHSQQLTKSPQECDNADRREKRVSEGRRNDRNTASSPDSTRRHNRQMKEENKQIRGDPSDTTSRLTNISDTAVVQTSKWNYPVIGATGTQCSRLLFGSDGNATASDCEEFVGKSMTQFLAAATSGTSNGMLSTDDTGGSMVNFSPSSTAQHNNENTTNRGLPSSSSSTKRPVARPPSGTRYDSPAAKIPRTTPAAASAQETSPKRSIFNNAQTRKPGALAQESRRAGESNPINNTARDNSGNNVGIHGASFSMMSQNFRIQAQSGGPVGLPQNAMVVTMEIGNVLYQGVLFGQIRR
ncbi:unnamed protein product [Dicrocoelium dendriticum]|nr:unnamed protein product [Dicrocoelium dendriticum]